MILFDNGLIVLDYDPATDILSVDMPTIDNLNIGEVKRALSLIVEHVRNYDVKRLLVDARNTRVEVDEETYTVLVGQFSQELISTRIQKVARILTTSSLRENVVKKIYDTDILAVQFESFVDRATALEWLKA